MKKFAIILKSNNIVQSVIEAINMQTSSDGYVVEIPLESTIKNGDFYNTITEVFEIRFVPEETI